MFIRKKKLLQQIDKMIKHYESEASAYRWIEEQDFSEIPFYSTEMFTNQEEIKDKKIGAKTSLYLLKDKLNLK